MKKKSFRVFIARFSLSRIAILNWPNKYSPSIIFPFGNQSSDHHLSRRELRLELLGLRGTRFFLPMAKLCFLYHRNGLRSVYTVTRRKIKWIAMHEKGLYAVCGQRRPRSGLSLTAYRINGYRSIFRRAENAQIRLHRCTVNSVLRKKKKVFTFRVNNLLRRLEWKNICTHNHWYVVQSDDRKKKKKWNKKKKKKKKMLQNTVVYGVHPSKY